MQSLEVSKIRGKNQKNFETCWLSIIDKGNFSKFFLFLPPYFWNFKWLLYVRRNFQNVAIDLAIHSHSAPIYRLRCISITRKKSYIYMTIVRIFFTFLQRIIHIFIIFYGFYKYWCTTSILPLYLLLSPSRNYLICNLQPLPTTVGGMLGFG